MIVKTQSGSTYRVDPTTGAWERLAHDPESRFLRTDHGEGFDIGEIVIGRSMMFIGPPLDGVAGHTRVIQTTPVVSIEQEART